MDKKRKYSQFYALFWTYDVDSLDQFKKTCILSIFELTPVYHIYGFQLFFAVILMWFFTSQSTIFQSYWDMSSWAEPVLSRG